MRRRASYVSERAPRRGRRGPPVACPSVAQAPQHSRHPPAQLSGLLPWLLGGHRLLGSSAPPVSLVTPTPSHPPQLGPASSWLLFWPVIVYVSHTRGNCPPRVSPLLVLPGDFGESPTSSVQPWKPLEGADMGHCETYWAPWAQCPPTRSLIAPQGLRKALGRGVSVDRWSSLLVAEYSPYNFCYVCCTNNLNMPFSLQIVEKRVRSVIKNASFGVRCRVFERASH